MYGRKTLTGLLASEGIRIAEKRVGLSMQTLAPHQHKAAQLNVARQLNPHPYTANYFGHKLHVDQNEKLVMYGVTHAMAIDGYSRKIISFITMPIKNCVEILIHMARYANNVTTTILLYTAITVHGVCTMFS